MEKLKREVKEMEKFQVGGEGWRELDGGDLGAENRTLLEIISGRLPAPLNPHPGSYKTPYHSSSSHLSVQVATSDITAGGPALQGVITRFQENVITLGSR